MQQVEEDEESQPSQGHTWWGSPWATAAANAFTRPQQTETSSSVNSGNSASLRKQQQLEDRLWHANKKVRWFQQRAARLTDELTEEHDSQERLKRVCILRARHGRHSADGEADSQECSSGTGSGRVGCSTSEVCTADNTAQQGLISTSVIPHRPGTQQRKFLSEGCCQHMQQALRRVFCCCRATSPCVLATSWR